MVEAARRVLLVSGLSGAGRSSILRLLEDLGHDAVDNAPLSMIDEIIRRGRGPMAIGVDARTDGFDGAAVIETLARLKQDHRLQAELIFAVADEAVLLRRYTATRRRHPLARGAGVLDGIAAETVLTAPLRAQADLVIDTTELTLPDLRRLMETRYADLADHGGKLTLSLVSFAFPAGLPRNSDMIFDARFLRNPFYEPSLAPLTGLDPAVARYIETDPDCRPFLDSILGILRLVLPRFVVEGKKYATIAIGCSGGRHRSVALIETVSQCLGKAGPADAWPGPFGRTDKPTDEPHITPIHEPLSYIRYPIIVTHRELTRADVPS